MCAIKSIASADAKLIQESPVNKRGPGQLWGMKGFAGLPQLFVDIWLVVILANLAPHQPRQDRNVVNALEFRFAVGMLVSRHPPRRSRRALLTHRALA